MSEYSTSGQLDLLCLLKEMHNVQKHTRMSLPLLVDINIHYRVMKFLYGESCQAYDFRLWLCNIPVLYGVWHPYKYCVLQVYRFFYPIFAVLEHGDIEAGKHMHCVRKLLHIEKLVCVLLLLRHSLVEAINAELAIPALASSNPVGIHGKRKIWLEGFLTLLNVYCPALLVLGCAVRDCTWDGRQATRGKQACGILQDCLALLVNLLGSGAHRVEYVRTICVALLGWNKWMDAIPGCCFQEENCEALLSRMAGRCRSNWTLSSFQQVSDLYVTLPPPKRTPKATRGARPLIVLVFKSAKN